MPIRPLRWNPTRRDIGRHYFSGLLAVATRISALRQATVAVSQMDLENVPAHVSLTLVKKCMKLQANLLDTFADAEAGPALVSALRCCRRSNEFKFNFRDLTIADRHWA